MTMMVSHDDGDDENTWRGMPELPFIDMWKSFGGGLWDFRGLYTSDQFYYHGDNRDLHDVIVMMAFSDANNQTNANF